MSDSLIPLIKRLAFSGKDYDQIIEVLNENKDNFSQVSIELAKDKINDQIVGYQLACQVKAKALNQLIIGFVLFMIGMIVTGVSANGNGYLLAFGAILSGAWTFKEGYKIYRQPLEDLVPRRSRLRR